MNGLAILGAILNGIGGIGTGYNTAEKIALAKQEEERRAAQDAARDLLLRDQMDQNQRQFDMTQAAQREARFTDLSTLPEPLRALIGNASGEMQTEQLKTLLTLAAAEKERGREQDQRFAQASVLERLGAGAPARASEPAPDEAAMYSEGRPASAAIAAIPEYQAIAGLLREGPLSEYLVKALEQKKREQQKFGHAAPGSAIFDERTGQVVGRVPDRDRPEADKYTTAGPGSVVFKNGEAVYTVPHAPRDPREPREPRAPTNTETVLQLTRERQALLRAGASESDPRVRDITEQIESISPGGRMTAGERGKVADLQATKSMVDSLIADTEKNSNVLGNIFSNPIGAVRRGLSEYRPSLTTPEEKEYLATLGFQIQQLKSDLIGASRTNPELKDLANTLPEPGNADASIIPKLKAIRRVLDSKLNARQAPYNGNNQRSGAGNDPLGIR